MDQWADRLLVLVDLLIIAISLLIIIILLQQDMEVFQDRDIWILEEVLVVNIRGIMFIIIHQLRIVVKISL